MQPTAVTLMLLLRSCRMISARSAAMTLSDPENKHGKKVAVSRDALDFLEQYSWPGNVRELENTLERTVVLANEGDTISAHDIPVLDRLFPSMGFGDSPMVGHSKPVSVPSPLPGLPGFSSMADSFSREVLRRPYQRAILTREALEQALNATNGHQTLAAKALGVTLRQLRYRIQQLQIEPREFRH